MMTDPRAPLIQSGIVDLMIATDMLRFRIETALRPVGINLTQMSLLNHFSWQPERAQSISELTEVMAIHQPGVTKAIASLADKGFVERIDSAKDARMKLVRITPQGLDALHQARQASYPTVEEAFSSLGDDDLPAFAKHLKAMKTHLTT